MNTISRLLLSAFLFCCAQAHAQGYPSKAVRIIVPSPAGGPTDVLTRLIAEKMAESFGHPVISDNRPGANSIIGAQAVAKAVPDGYTLLMALDSTLSLNPSLFAKLPYDPQKDFAPITRTASSPIILIVDAAVGPKSIQDLLQQAKAAPGKLSFGTGTPPTRLGGELLKSMAGVDMLNVPFKSSTGTVQGLLSRDVTFILDGVPAALPHIKSGKFRVLANLSSLPIEALPGLPLLSAEPGMQGYEVVVWLGLVAPAGTPADIVGRLQQETVRILGLPEIRAKLSNIGLIPVTSTPAEFAAFIRTETERWGKVIRQAGIKLDQ